MSITTNSGQDQPDTPRTNWAGNLTYSARAVVRPRSVEEAQELIAGAPRIGFLGSRHSFNEIGDAEVLMVFDELPEVVEVDHGGGSVTVSGSITYGALSRVLAREQVALANLASLPHISVAGAISTGTHGSGDRNGSLATSVRAMQLIRADGELVTVSRGEPGFDGCVVSLGALGAIASVTLDIEPAYEVRQRTWQGVALETALERFDEITALGYSVSLFTLWDRELYLVWVKSRVTGGEAEPVLALPGARASTANLHPIPGLDPVHCTEQLGRAGPWFDRLPHFRMGFVPSVGDELQSEFLVDRRRAPEALAAVADLGAVVAPVLQVSEIRTIAADALWMSPAYGRDTVGIHFTWKADPVGVEPALREIEAALAPFEARPHWGKVFLGERVSMDALYPRLADFVSLAERHDPRGAFRNPWLERHVFGMRGRGG